MRPPTRRLATVATWVAIALVGCQAATVSHPREQAALDGTNWILDGLPGRAVTERARPTAQFSGDRLSGTDGCNRYSGRYEAGVGTFKVLPDVAVTQMACEPGINDQAQAYLQALLGARSAHVGNGTLTLRDAAGATLATFVAQSTVLAGTSWRVAAINNGKGGVVSAVDGTDVSVEFGADGSATGSSGCNRYTTRYTQEGDALRFESPAATRKACLQPGVMEQEQAFLHALATVTAAQFDGERLQLRQADGALALSLHRAAHR